MSFCADKSPRGRGAGVGMRCPREPSSLGTVAHEPSRRTIFMARTVWENPYPRVARLRQGRRGVTTTKGGVDVALDCNRPGRSIRRGVFIQGLSRMTATCNNCTAGSVVKSLLKRICAKCVLGHCFRVDSFPSRVQAQQGAPALLFRG